MQRRRIKAPFRGPLKGAGEPVRDFFMSNMSTRAAKMLIDDMQALGPVRLREVDEAQSQLVNLAKDLAAKGEIASLADTRDPAPDGLRAAARRIRALALAAPVPAPVRESLHALRAATGLRAPLIVRSSAIGEDSARASFAGQLDSLPDVSSPEALERALVACWASYWSERAMAYQLARGVRLAGMGVVVQELVRSRVSGVLFTAHPGGARPPRLERPELPELPELEVEYCAGRGEALVSGRLDPGRFTLARDGRVWRLQGTPGPPPGDTAIPPTNVCGSAK